MAGKSPVEIGPAKFDLESVTAFALAHPFVFWGALGAMFLFWVARKNGILGLWIDYKKAKNENQTKVELGRQALIRKFGIAQGPTRVIDALPSPPQSLKPAHGAIDVQAMDRKTKLGSQKQ